ncbi:membrane protein [Streptacidiphilus sp. MAP12-16]|uniref:YihY/virulence factor BrkB family protein n=1 Tax=Streptacidiphilus sp. MAP12-16 TaxID=3156300 RepID=UPI0035168FE1
MDRLTRLPVLGPVVAWVLRTRAYRVFEHFNDIGSNRLAGAVTFFGFLALFPLLTVAMAIAVATLDDAQVQHVQKQIEAQIPSLAQSLDLASLVRNAGTVGLVSAALLLVSGLGWVDTTRASVRTVWRLPEEPGNPVQRKALDVGVLVGLGLVTAVSIGASSVTSALTSQVARALGIDHWLGGRFLLGLSSFVIAVGADMMLFAYLLVGLPRIPGQRRRVVAQGALLGAVGFELLKLLISTYLSQVAGKSVYGAFGTPVALLLWINFVCRWLFFCVAWTATADPVAAGARARARAEEDWREAGGGAEVGAGGVGGGERPGSAEAPTDRPPALRSPRAAMFSSLAAFASGAATATALRHLRRGRRQR